MFWDNKMRYSLGLWTETTRAKMSVYQLLSLLVVTSWAALAEASYSGKVLLISMDGFRHDYLQHVNHTPNFDRFEREGVRAPYVNSHFTTVTFPMHYTLATGLYQENHGIVSNSFYDPVLNDTFTMRSGPSQSRWWSNGEPIWITARKQGKKSATYFFPGGEVENHGLRPNFWRPYNESVAFTDRVDQAVDWFVSESVHMVALYFNEPDSTGHEYGPNSSEVRKKIEELDTVLGYLLEKLENESILDDVNVILTSDHGMTSVDVTNRIIDISVYLNVTGKMWDIVESVPDRGSVCHVWPKTNKTKLVYELLKNAHPNMTVYLKEEIPDRFHYKHNSRIPPVLIVADEGWMVTDFIPEGFNWKGAHGYDNDLSSMKPIFLARGPDIMPNYQSHPFDTVDIYPLMCKLLGIKPAPNNGSLRVAGTFLRHETKFVPPTGSTGQLIPQRFLFTLWVAFAQYLLST